jgi:hypothetical protein
LFADPIIQTFPERLDFHLGSGKTRKSFVSVALRLF